MTKWTSIARDQASEVAGSAVPRLVGDGTARRMSPHGYPLWLFETALTDGATLRWPAPETDEALYVLDGELDVGGLRCPEGGAVIVERGARATATAVGPTTVIHVGSSPEVAPALDDERAGGVVHVVGPDGRFESGTRENVHAVWFADGTCDGCDLQLFTVQTPPLDDRQGRAHSHSQDEIIYLLDGSVTMGAHTFGPGTAVSIPADVRYALRAHGGGHRFLNFRRAVSWQIYELGSDPLLETAAARGGRVTTAT